MEHIKLDLDVDDASTLGLHATNPFIHRKDDQVSMALGTT
jgi:hypothetical protein